MIVTLEEYKKSLECSGLRFCPFCTDNNADHVKIDFTNIACQFRCEICNKRWKEIYGVVALIEL